MSRLLVQVALCAVGFSLAACADSAAPLAGRSALSVGAPAARPQPDRFARRAGGVAPTHALPRDARFDGGPGEAGCFERCSGLPFCASLCDLDAAGQDRADAFERAAKDDCLACGRETGFIPAPPAAIEAVVDGAGVVVRWRPMDDAEQYELVVDRQKLDDAYPTRFADEVVLGTEWRFTMLPPDAVYTFTVAPYIDGEVVEDLSVTSDPLSL